MTWHNIDTYYIYIILCHLYILLVNYYVNYASVVSENCIQALHRRVHSACVLLGRTAMGFYGTKHDAVRHEQEDSAFKALMLDL